MPFAEHFSEPRNNPIHRGTGHNGGHRPGADGRHEAALALAFGQTRGPATTESVGVPFAEHFSEPHNNPIHRGTEHNGGHRPGADGRHKAAVARPSARPGGRP